jgi:hypothetical protein
VVVVVLVHPSHMFGQSDRPSSATATFAGINAMQRSRGISTPQLTSSTQYGVVVVVVVVVVIVVVVVVDVVVVVVVVAVLVVVAVVVVVTVVVVVVFVLLHTPHGMGHAAAAVLPACASSSEIVVPLISVRPAPKFNAHNFKMVGANSGFRHTERSA